jgi:hypothetical protein
MKPKPQSAAFNFRKRLNIFSVACAVFLSCYLGFILPLHHHADGTVHEDCAMCVVQNQPADVAIAFCLISIAVAFSTTIPCQETAFSRISPLVYLIRAPPVKA